MFFSSNKCTPRPAQCILNIIRKLFYCRLFTSGEPIPGYTRYYIHSCNTHYGIVALLSVTCSQMFLNCHPLDMIMEEGDIGEIFVLLLDWTPFKYQVPSVTMVPIVMWLHRNILISLWGYMRVPVSRINDYPTVYSRGNWCLIDVDPRVFAI